jgi:hypothetical protein
VIAHAAHPGVVRSGFAKDGDTQGVQRIVLRGFAAFGASPAVGARTSTFLASSDEARRPNGGYWVCSRQHRPSAAASDVDAGVRLWDVSDELVAAAGVGI